MTKGASSISDPPAEARADPQDPLPESNWLWRRLIVVVSACVITGIIVGAGLLIRALGEHEPITAINALLSIVHWLCAILIVDRVLYMVAPSAEQVTKMLATVSALKSGVSFRTSTEVVGDGIKASTTSSATPRPVPTAEDGDLD
ncbi:MAG: hypothetical protein KKA05_11910 [Alphaproteobacteria bacterium]|nr:hypothetical protein [Alphaproteobacteria bacterium]